MYRYNTFAKEAAERSACFQARRKKPVKAEKDTKLRKEMKSFLLSYDTKSKASAFLAKPRNERFMEEEQCLAGYFISLLMGGDEATLPDILQATVGLARKAEPSSDFSVVAEEEALHLPETQLTQLQL